MAWLLDERLKLPCGCYPDETVGVEHDDAWLVEPVICQKHRAMGEADERWQSNANEATVRHGVMWHATREPEGR